jgi:hypothetical protein
VTRWRWLWLILLAVILTFEFVAIVNDEPDDTISENVWALLSLSWLLWLILGAVLLWLTVHFLLPKVREWWRRKPW